MTFFQLEGGESAAARLLDAYDRSTGTWSIPRVGEFWDVVGLAHARGLRGKDRRIAILDVGFDQGIPALAAQRFVHPNFSGESTDHGTAVALLVHEVAPDAELLLYPVGMGGVIDAGLVEEALGEVATAGVDVVNLSFGQPHPWSEVQDLAGAPTANPGTPSSFFDILEGFALGSRGRTRVNTDHLPFCRLARHVAERGITVVAAVGNAEGEVYSPAIDDRVVACGFQVTRRQILEGGNEVAWAEGPEGYGQSSLNADFLIKQPAGVLGSSFGAPLFAGFVALMRDPSELPAYLESGRLAALGGEGHRVLAPPWEDRKHGVVHRIYEAAVQVLPHHHGSVSPSDPCPECALFARPAYLNGGLLVGESGNLEGAEAVLRTVRGFAPFDEHTAATLAVILTERVKRGVPGSTAGPALAEARRHIDFALGRRPDQPRWSERREEILTLQAAFTAPG